MDILKVPNPIAKPYTALKEKLLQKHIHKSKRKTTQKDIIWYDCVVTARITLLNYHILFYSK